MKARVAFVFALWTALVVGVVQLFQVAAGPVVVGAAVLGGLLIGRTFVAARRRWRRLRSWRRPGEPALAPSHYPIGPRRVLLVNTGLAAPRTRAR